MDKELTFVAEYFSFFEYSPSFEEIYTFFPKKITKNRLKTLIKARKYTLPEYSSLALRKRISKEKLSNWRFKTYIALITWLPQIKLIGLSGSISMMNADLDHDIDLFIVTSENRLFTARFLATLIAFIMGLKRTLGQIKAPNKVCLNLFFDEADLKIPRHKQNLFVGHELLQMKPIVNKSQIYERLLQANKWVFRIFPNAKHRLVLPRIQNQRLSKIGNWLEKKLKKIQMRLINRHKTTEFITDTQLWFHPDDFEKKLKIPMVISS